MVRPLILPLPRGAGFGEFKRLPLKTRGDHSFEFNLFKDHAHFSVGSLLEHCHLLHFLGELPSRGGSIYLFRFLFASD